MKKNVFLWAAVFAVGAMSSCSVDKVVDQAEARYIGFDAFANKVTRGLNATEFGHDDFDVWGKYDAVEVFHGKTVSWETSSWTYQPLVPWVSGKTYEFAVIAPHVDGASYNYTDNTYTLGQITVDATEANQIDYMTADPQETVQSGASPVSFVFNHILSKIDFKFQPKTTSSDNTHWQSPVRIEITKIELANVPTKNTYTSDAWQALDAPETNRVTFTDNASSVSTSYDGTSTVTPSDNTFDWLVVPQGTTSGEITKTLTITCNVYDNATSGGTLLKSNATASVDIKTAWAKNTYYTYTVYIGSNILGTNPYITFDVTSVTNWATGTTNNLEVSTTTQP